MIGGVASYYAYNFAPGAGGAYSTALGNGYAQAAVAGFFSGVAATGTVKGGFQGAFAGAVFYGAGEFVTSNGGPGYGSGQAFNGGRYAYAVVVHGVAGCVVGAATNQGCSAGALSASFGKALGPLVEGQNVAIATLATAAIGGVAAELNGGTFANGAATAAFGYLFNFLAHVHKGLTYDALKNGMADERAKNIAALASGVDWSPSWSVSQDPTNAVWHGLCSGGDGAALCDLKRTDYLNAQWEKRSIDGFVRLAHAIQDFEAPLHGGRPYGGFTTATEAMIHGMSDLRPPPDVWDRLVARTRQLYVDYNRQCNGCIR